MALKYKLTKAQHGKLSEDLQGEYVEKDGSFVLDIEGLPEPEGAPELKRAKDREKQRADDAEDEVKELTDKLDTALKTQGKGDKDVARLTKSHDKAMADLITENDNKVAKLTKFIDKEVKGSRADAIAAKISTAPKLLAPEIGKRMNINYEGDEPVLEYLGADGKADAKLTTETLTQEFVANKEYAAIIVGSKAKGSGGSLDNIPGSRNSVTPGDKPLDLAAAPTTDLLSHVRAAVEAKRAANNGQS